MQRGIFHVNVLLCNALVEQKTHFTSPHWEHPTQICGSVFCILRKVYILYIECAVYYCTGVDIIHTSLLVSAPAHSLCIESIQSGPGMSTICSIYILDIYLYTWTAHNSWEQYIRAEISPPGDQRWQSAAQSTAERVQPIATSTGNGVPGARVMIMVSPEEEFTTSIFFHICMSHKQIAHHVDTVGWQLADRRVFTEDLCRDLDAQGAKAA